MPDDPQESPSFPWGKLLLGCLAVVLLFIGGCTAMGLFVVKKITDEPVMVDNQEAARLIQPLEPKISACAAESDSLIAFAAGLEKLALPALLALELKIEAPPGQKLTVKAPPEFGSRSSLVVNGYGSGNIGDRKTLILDKKFVIKSGLNVGLRAEFDSLGLSQAAPVAATPPGLEAK